LTDEKEVLCSKMLDDLEYDVIEMESSIKDVLSFPSTRSGKESLNHV
jgi:hypothetical protein